MQLLFEIRIRKTCKPLMLEYFKSHNLNLHNFKVAIDMIEYRRILNLSEKSFNCHNSSFLNREKYQYEDIGVYSLHIRSDTR